MNQMIKLEVSAQHLNIINQALLQMPYASVAQLIDILQAQVRAQMQPRPVAAPAAEPAADAA